jgi:hypothetical protein
VAVLAKRGFVFVAIGLSLLSATACGPAKSRGGTTAGTLADTGPSSASAAAMPTKGDLADRYVAASGPYNAALRRNLPTLNSDSATLAQRKSGAADMANANWTLMEKYRAIQQSVEMPPGGYPRDADFYKEIKEAIGRSIEKSLKNQDLWTRMRDARTLDELNTAWDDDTYYDDGSTQRRVRSLLGLPDVPNS